MRPTPSRAEHCWDDVIDAPTRAVYAQYERERHVGRHPALLAIDLYLLVFEGGPRPVVEVVEHFPSSCGIHAWNAIQPMRRLLRAAREAKLPILYTTSETRPDARSEVRATRRGGASPDPSAFEIYQEFAPLPGDVIVRKQRASAFFGTPLVAHLVQGGIDSVIVCGESTSGCVRASVVDAYSNGFHVVVVEECCFDRSPLSHKVNLFDMHQKYADVLHLEEVEAELLPRVTAR